MEDTFTYENFFDREHISSVLSECMNNGVSKDFINKTGMFKDQLIAKEKSFANVETEDNLPNLKILLQKIKTIFDFPVEFSTVNFQILYLPWDIHCDWKPADEDQSLYNLLIPLQDADSRTFIFDQNNAGLNSKHFYAYKEQKQKCLNPVPVDIWNENLNFCWPEDREYLSIKEIMPYQRAGQLQGFLRNHYHSSDNFHLKGASPKYFIQIIVDKAGHNNQKFKKSLKKYYAKRK